MIDGFVNLHLLSTNANAMRGINRVTLMGNLGKEPDMQFLEGNIAVAKFSLATSEIFKDKTGKQVTQTEWHNVVLWRGLAELAQKYLHKGSLVYVEGRLKTRSWDDKDGNKKFATEIIGDNLIMLDKRVEGLGAGDGLDTPSPSTDAPTQGEGPERLPF